MLRAGQTNPFSDIIVEKNRVQHEKNIYFTRVVATLALLGHQTSHSQNNFFFPSYTIYYIYCIKRGSGQWAGTQLRFMVYMCFVVAPSCECKRENGGERENIRPEQTLMKRHVRHIWDLGQLKSQAAVRAGYLDLKYYTY